MLFKDLKQGYSVYILNKQTLTITVGKVTQVGFPRADFNKSMGQPNTVVDITIEADGKTATYTIPESLSVTYANDLVLATDKQGLSCEVEAMKSNAEKVLESVDRQREIVDKTSTLLAELNPVYKEKKETDERFNKMENSISRLENTVTNFINTFNNARSNSNTTQ